jgi:hypothetical protein
MTLPASGAISFNNINVELGVAGTTSASLGQASYRTLAGVPTGAIAMSNFYGKSNSFAFTISANTVDANLRTLALAAGWGGSSNLVATIGSGIYVYSSSTGSPGLTINGAFPAGVTLVNNGLITGRGGQGGKGHDFTPASAGAAGGTALAVSVAVTINNASGTVGGGGGGGGGANAFVDGQGDTYVGAGGGGGRVNGTGGPQDRSAPAGNPGSLTAPGTGGSYFGISIGGTGGGLGSAGATGGTAGAGGGGQAGGPSGAAITGNSNITWTSFGTRLGPIS